MVVIPSCFVIHIKFIKSDGLLIMPLERHLDRAGVLLFGPGSLGDAQVGYVLGFRAHNFTLII